MRLRHAWLQTSALDLAIVSQANGCAPIPPVPAGLRRQGADGHATGAAADIDLVSLVRLGPFRQQWRESSSLGGWFRRRHRLASSNKEEVSMQSSPSIQGLRIAENAA